MAAKIQVRYTRLDLLIYQAYDQAYQVNLLYEKLRSQKETLKNSWQGGSAAEFQGEMEEVVLPRLKRLSNALKETGDLFEKIKAIFQVAEQEAVACFPDGSEAAQNAYIEWVHGILDVVGFIPGVGEIADGANALIYLGEGRFWEAGISAAAMLPVFGDTGKVGKWGVRAGREIAETTVERGIREATAKKLVDEAVMTREIFNAKRVPIGKVPAHEMPTGKIGPAKYGDKMHEILPPKIERDLQEQFPGIKFDNTTKGYEGPDMKVDKSCNVDPGFDYIEIKPDTESGVGTFIRTEWGKSEVWEGRGRLLVYDKDVNYKFIDYELSTE